MKILRTNEEKRQNERETQGKTIPFEKNFLCSKNKINVSLVAIDGTFSEIWCYKIVI